ncbi:MAG TPA: hypothetical protein VGQ83_11645 [Polyangia bacterium]
MTHTTDRITRTINSQRRFIVRDLVTASLFAATLLVTLAGLL